MNPVPRTQYFLSTIIHQVYLLYICVIITWKPDKLQPPLDLCVNMSWKRHLLITVYNFSFLFLLSHMQRCVDLLAIWNVNSEFYFHQFLKIDFIVIFLYIYINVNGNATTWPMVLANRGLWFLWYIIQYVAFSFTDASISWIWLVLVDSDACWRIVKSENPKSRNSNCFEIR